MERGRGCRQRRGRAGDGQARWPAPRGRAVQTSGAQPPFSPAARFLAASCAAPPSRCQGTSPREGRRGPQRPPRVPGGGSAGRCVPGGGPGQRGTAASERLEPLLLGDNSGGTGVLGPFSSHRVSQTECHARYKDIKALLYLLASVFKHLAKFQCLKCIRVLGPLRQVSNTLQYFRELCFGFKPIPALLPLIEQG